MAEGRRQQLGEPARRDQPPDLRVEPADFDVGYDGMSTPRYQPPPLLTPRPSRADSSLIGRSRETVPHKSPDELRKDIAELERRISEISGHSGMRSDYLASEDGPPFWSGMGSEPRLQRDHGPGGLPVAAESASSHNEVGGAAAVIAGNVPTAVVTRGAEPVNSRRVVVSESAKNIIGATGGQNHDESSASGRSKVPPTIKLSSFDGSSPLASHLAKFENCSGYYQWNARERLCHLKSSLDGQAGQVLWQLPKEATEADLISLLRNRWGDENQAERFRAELASRRRKPGESAQAVYNDIRRLLALSFPGESGNILEVIGRDSFLTALNDPALRIRVLDQRPVTLDDALNAVCRMEAYGLPNDSDVSADPSDRRKVRTVKSDDMKDHQAAVTDMERRLRHMEQSMESQRREVRQLSADAEHWRQRAMAAELAVQYPAPAHQPSPMNYQGPEAYQPMPPPPAVYQQPTATGTFQSVPARQLFRGGGRSRRGGTNHRQSVAADDDVCHCCGQLGHWQRSCPNRVSGASFQPGSSVAGVQNVCSPCSQTYVDAKLWSGEKKRDCSFLIDSGCDRNILPRRLGKKVKLNTADEQTVFAANGAQIKILGSAFFHICIAGQNLREKFLCTDEIDEPILGFEFLRKNNCVWSFENAELCVNGVPVKLRERPSHTQVRRIYVRESVCVPADSTVNVPVRLPFNDFYSPSCEWLAEAKVLRPGVFLARTLLPQTDEFAAMCAVNVSGKDQLIRCGLCLGRAEPGYCVSVSESIGALNGDDVTGAPNVSVVTSSPCSFTGHAHTVTEQPDCHEQYEGHAHTVAVDDVTDMIDGETPGNAAAVCQQACVAASQRVSNDQTDAQSQCYDFSELSDEELFLKFEGEFHFLKPIIVGLPEDFNPSERRRIAELVLKNSEVFSQSEFHIGCTDLMQHKIDTGTHPPISEPLRRHPKAYLETIDSTVDQLLSAGIIEPACSPWSFNIVLVKKRDSETPRVTVDYRKLNSVTVRDQHPLPLIKDCLDSLSDSVLYTTLDISSSFYSVPLQPCDKNKTAFSTRRGQFRFTRMPMGTCNSPAAFSRLMALVLRDLTYLICLSFIDDCIVIGRSFDEHLSNVQTVLQRLKHAKLLLKPKKCCFFQHQVKFLGHIVSKDGVGVDPQKTSVISQWPFPKTVSELRGFLGLCSYYRSFCKGFAEIAAPLSEMLRKGAKVEATERRLKAFQDLKSFLTSAPLLAMPRDQGEWLVDVDASGKSLGAVCSQWQDGRYRVVEFASRTLSRAEESYCVTRREALGLVFALKQFRVYLIGQKSFRVRSDHRALQYFAKTREPGGQIARYLDFLSDFNFTLEYKPGRLHTNCDSLSRIRPCEIDGGQPCKQCHKRVGVDHITSVTTRSATRKNHDEVTESTSSNTAPPGESARNDRAAQNRPAASNKSRRQRNTGLLFRTAPNATAAGCMEWSPELLRGEQEKDPDIGEALEWVRTNQKPPWKTVKSKSPMLRALFRQYESLILRDGVLCRIFHNANGVAMYYQTVLPRSLRSSLLELVHSDAAGHLRLEKSMEHVQRRAWWLEWRTDLKIFLENCSKCAAYHRGPPPKQAPLNPMVVGSPASMWTVDLVGPMPQSNGFRYIFTAVDAYTKFAVAVPMRQKDAKTVAKIIVEHIFLRWGLASSVLSDLGPEFQNEISTELFNLLGIRRLRSSGYRPQTAGSIERWHRVLNSLLAKVISENQRDWSSYLSYVVFCYNASYHSATRFSPFFLMTGRDPLWTVDLLVDGSDSCDRTVPEYVQEVRQRLEVASRLVRENLNRAATSAADWYDRKVHIKTFCPGDKVRLYCPRRYKGRSPKLQSNYLQTGEVLGKINESTYLVKTTKGNKIFHTDKLKLIPSND